MPVILTKDTLEKIDRENLFNVVEKYISDYYNPRTINSVKNVIFHRLTRRLSLDSVPSVAIKASPRMLQMISNLFHNRHNEMSFSEKLMSLIENKGLKTKEVYKGANITKQNFSKIKNDIYYQPSKGTALALAISLHLDLEETQDLIRRAGFTLSHTIKSDVIVEYFIKEKFYDVKEINMQLYERGLTPLNNNREMKEKDNADSKNVSETDSSSD